MSRQIWNEGDTGDVTQGVIDANFTELYQRDFIHLESFGAVGDGVTDDASALQAAFDFANTNDKNIQFGSGKTYVCSASRILFYGGVIEGNFSTLKVTYDSSGVSYGIYGFGSIGTFYNLSDNAARGTDIVPVTNATFLAAVSVGDIVKVTSEADFVTAGIKQGETAMVTAIDVDKIYLAGKLNDNYLTSNTAKIAIITPVEAAIRNLNIEQNASKSMPTGADGTFGVYFKYGKNILIDNCSTLWCRYASIQIEDSYASVVRNSIAQACDLTGLGYGVQITGACTNTVIDGAIAMGCRHAVTFGGNIGVPHLSLVTNCTGDSRLNVHIFDSHADCGNVVFANCTAIGGVLKADRDYFQGVWDSGTEYVNTGAEPDIVERNHALYECAAASSTGNDPETSTDWTRYVSATYGFLVLGKESSIIDCKVINCDAGANIATITADSIAISKLECINVRYGLNISSSTITNFSADNISVKNAAYKSNDYILRIVGSILTNTNYGKFTGFNCGGVYLNDTSGNIVIGELDCTNVVFGNASITSDVHIHINKLEFTDDGSGVAININDANIKSLVIDEAVVYSLDAVLVYVSADCELVQINNLALYDCTANYQVIVVTTGNTLSNLILGKIYMEGTAKQLLNNLGTITNYHLGQLFGSVTTEMTGNNPTIQLIQGTTLSPNLIKVAGSPEGSVTAPVGCMAIRSDGGAGTSLYIKESGAGNTGWVAK